MERLSRHILSLLRLYDSVALPGIGFFNIEYISARYDADEGIFYPPFYSLSFKITYVAEDNLLLHSYERKENISKEEAWALMKGDIDNFLDLLEEDEEVALSGIGTFVYQDDEIDFFPSFSLNISLPTIKVPRGDVFVNEQGTDTQEIESDRQKQEEVAPQDKIDDEPENIPEPSIETPLVETNAPIEEKTEIIEVASNLPESKSVETVNGEEEEKKTEEADSSIIYDVSADAERSNAEQSAVEQPASEQAETERLVAEQPAAELQEEKTQDRKKRKYKIPKGYYYHKPEYFYFPIHRAFAKICACVLLVVIVGLVAIWPLGSNVNSSGTASILPISGSDKAAKEDTVSISKDDFSQYVPKDREEQPRSASNKRPLLATNEDGEVIPGANSLPTAPYLQSDDNLSKYYAVVAAMKTEQELDKFMSTHKGELQKFKIIRNNKTSLVTVASSDDRQNLENQLPLIRTDYPNVWIFTMK